jgi:hypothetical protein
LMIRHLKRYGSSIRLRLKSLPPQDKRNPFTMDIGLDAQGRAVKIDYDLNYTP